MSNRTPLNVADYRELARRRLPKMVFDYLDGGAEDEKGLAHNRSVFDSLRFKPKRLIDVSQRELATPLFGKPQAMPLLIGPTGLNGALWPEGDLALARAAARAGIPFVLSTASNLSIEDVARRCEGELWFQLYVVHRSLAGQMVDRALAAGYRTLVLTTDVGVNGYRERDLRNAFKMPMSFTPNVLLDGFLHPRWSLDLVRHGMPQLANFVSSQATSIEVQAALMSRQMDASFDWQALRWLRDKWPHRLLVKGVLDEDDAARCIAEGVDGVILSNHGGRQLDGAISPIEVLAQTAASIDAPVLVDSGFRRGADVVKALCLGADAVLLGRATLYGLAARGEAGVDEVLRLLKDDIDRTLAHIGCPSVQQLSPAYLDLQMPSAPDRSAVASLPPRELARR
ncbi:alpha-hydroxy-acid oxidizing protein [Pseudomonas sp. R5(2019)]|uniref:alpha-hydroxy-acid oxidizing protein n=1 Tax=Pseudomonas sp. R5(2019) TaxID=2697566 RepID=UPI0014121882|nr:alpha-hydroxy-acid oxidizing protein [Pseudomonas sp. R5(2019)]NBA93634.1 mandelate dehydrogenase [Pseudomonas sp. R5(2019)]